MVKIIIEAEDGIRESQGDSLCSCVVRDQDAKIALVGDPEAICIGALEIVNEVLATVSKAHGAALVAMLFKVIFESGTMIDD